MMSDSGAPSKKNLPTLHHLQESQSQRILWLLEELGVEYNLKLYLRTPQQRAPEELALVHPLGKSPCFVTADGRVIIESSAIATYVLRTYDTDGRFASEDWIRDETLTSFAGATIGPNALVELLFDLAAKHTPWPFSYLMKAILGAVRKNFTGPEFKKQFDYLQNDLGDKEWFNGTQLGRCDFALSWPMDMVSQRGYVNFEKDYPKLAAWRNRIQERPAWKRALEKGNGYDLTEW